MKEVQFRKAEPKDVNQAVPLMLESGPEAFAYVLDNGVQAASDFLKFAFPKKGGEFSYENHFVLERENYIIGIGAIYYHEKSKGFLLKDLSHILAIEGWRSFNTIRKGLRIERILIMPEKQEYYIGQIAILENERGKGFGNLLMQKIIGAISTEAGESFVLDVDNLKAKKLYKKLDFEISRLMRSSLETQFGKVPSHYRMVKPLA
jgi:ribosomal protein S18 acetylase RimI-like enzyme